MIILISHLQVGSTNLHPCGCFPILDEVAQVVTQGLHSYFQVENALVLSFYHAQADASNNAWKLTWGKPRIGYHLRIFCRAGQ